MLRQRVRLLVEIAALAATLAGGVISADDEAGNRVTLIADAGDVAPSVGRVGGVDDDGIAMTAAMGLGRVVIAATAGVAHYVLICSQRDCLDQILRLDAHVPCNSV